MRNTIKPFILKALIGLVLGTGAVVRTQAQDQALKDLIESVAGNLPEEYDLSELAERLSWYRKHPINLNHTTSEELKNLVFLSPLQISNFFAHLQSNGKLLDLLELQSIAAFEPNDLENILPFVTLKPPGPFQAFSFKNLINKGKAELILRYAQTLETQKGFTALPGSRYMGGPEKLLGKFRYNYGNTISASLVVKKDAGEYFFSGNNKSFDFISGSLSVSNIGRIKKLVLGDYGLQFGQGLTLWSGFGYGKGPDVTSVAKKDVGLKPYTSANESSFFRGAAANLRLFGYIELSPFVSFRNLDASLTKTTEGISTLVNISISGLHRTTTEIRNKKSIGQLVYGTALQYNSNNLTIGAVVYQSRYGHPFVTGSQQYNAFGFIGDKLTNAGVHYNYTFSSIYFYGEIASSLDGGNAMINGMMSSISRTLSVVLVHRHYAPAYHNFFSQGIGESSDAANENGFYGGMNIVPNKRWAISVYTDYFRFPWLKYRIDAPSAGYELLGQLSFTPNKTCKAVFRFKMDLKAQNTDDKFSERLLDNVFKENYRIKVDWKPNKIFNCQNCLEVVQYKKGSAHLETAFLLYQDLDYAPKSSRISANIRLAWFNTPSYNSRLYAYEDDVPGGASFGMYNGKGFRSYLNLRCRLGRQINIWTKYAVSLYPNAETTGSGLDLINGNKKSEIKIQLRYEF